MVKKTTFYLSQNDWKCTVLPAFAFKVCKKCYYDFHKCWFQIRWCRLKKIPLKRLCQFWVFLYLHIFGFFFANNQNLQNVILWLNLNFSWKNINMGIKKRRMLCWFQIRWCRLKKMILKKLWKFFVFAHFFFEHFWLLVRQIHRKKAFWYSSPQPECHLPNCPWAGIMTSYINYSRLGRVW